MEQELEAKIKIHEDELESLMAKCSYLEEENRNLRDQREEIEAILEQKKKEFDEKNIARNNQSSKKIKVNREDSNNLERREKELNDYIRLKLLGLLIGEDNAISNASDYYEKGQMIITSVVVRYAPDAIEGDINSFEKSDPSEAHFRINKSTTFQQLKDTVCMFWVISI
jgi:seryl-tRNA synthetase